MSRARPKVLFAASECLPFLKTGGLADVSGALPAALAAQGADVRVIMPKYRQIPEEYKARMTHATDFIVDLGWRNQYCGIETLVENGITYYFVDNEYYFGRDYVYGRFCTDEGERFAFFSKAVIKCMPAIGFMPDVLHLNDWQTGMAAALLKTQYSRMPDYRGIKTVFTIHNLRFQGIFDWGFMSELMYLSDDLFTSDKLEYNGCINFLKAGLVYADVITTVSPTYASEIQTGDFGEGLDGVLRARSNCLKGILNGVDERIYNPETDTLIGTNYSARNISGKALCKAALQRELDLPGQAETPLVAMITRLTDQKGLDLVECVINDMMRQDMQLVVLGSGEPRYEQLFSWAAWRYPDKVRARFEYNEPLAHRMYAGADMFLMPSRFEPCGIAQLIAMRYGTVPIVRETGGLRDSVAPYNKYINEGTGFSFANYNAHEMLYTIEHAVAYYNEDKAMWAALAGRAMDERFSWSTAAKAYMKLYRG